MKSIFSITFNKTLVLICLIFSGLPSIAQLSLGAGGTFGALNDEAGLNVRMGFTATNGLRASADFNFYKTIESMVDNETYSSQSHESNFNGSYVFRSKNVFFYPFAGLNILKTKVHTQIGNYASTTDYFTQMGLNLGGGLQHHFDIVAKTFAVAPFIEGKVILGKQFRPVATGGINFLFGWDKYARKRK